MPAQNRGNRVEESGAAPPPFEPFEPFEPSAPFGNQPKARFNPYPIYRSAYLAASAFFMRSTASFVSSGVLKDVRRT